MGLSGGQESGAERRTGEWGWPYPSRSVVSDAILALEVRSCVPSSSRFFLPSASARAHHPVSDSAMLSSRVSVASAHRSPSV